MKSAKVSAGDVTPALNSVLTDILADQGIEVVSQAEVAFVNAWAKKHHPRRRYLTDAQFTQARAEYAKQKTP